MKRLLYLGVVLGALIMAAPAQAHFTDSAWGALHKAAVRECSNHGGYFVTCVPHDGWTRWSDFDPYINFYDPWTAVSGTHFVTVHYAVCVKLVLGCRRERWGETLWFVHGGPVHGSNEWRL